MPKNAAYINTYVERLIQSRQVTCLDHFLVFGEKHLDYLIREYVEHYHTEPPHQGLGNRVIEKEPPAHGNGSVNSARQISCHTRLGGLLKHYSRRAA